MNTTCFETEKMKKLIGQIEKADLAYYRDDHPIMSDREYDKLTDELQLLEQQCGIILSGSPIHKVPGEILEELVPVRHTVPMLSANKTKSIEDLVKFAGTHSVLLSWKLDGLTLVLRYKDGRLKQAITRGREGIIGEDVTHTVKTFLNVPLIIPTKDDFEVRGEGVISWSNFEKINLGLEEPYSHPRNFASGSVRKLDASDARKRMLEFWAFELVSENMDQSSKITQMQFLEDNGFSVVPFVYIDSIENDRKIREAVSKMDPQSFAYPVDGLILEYNDLAYGRSLGSTGHHTNRLIALKWQDELYETRFLGAELATTRTGMVSITGLLEPVEIDGTTINRAYLHNLDIFEDFRFGIGDTVKVYKANMIIPQIAENISQTGTYQLDMHCPCCGSALTVEKTSGGTRQLYCHNPNCSARLVQKFAHFCEKTRMDIEGLSDTTLEKLIGHGWIHTFADLYDLEKYREEIIRTEGFGEKSFERLQASIEKSRQCTLAKFIAGLGIPMVGRHAGREIDKYFHGSWTAFEEAICNGFDFTVLSDFGKIMNDNIYTWYQDKNEETLWRPLLEKVIFTKENVNMKVSANNPFFGKIVVATGKLENYTRDEIQTKLLSLGAVPASSVTKKTDYLIVGEKAGSKLTKAEQLGIRTLSEDEFEALLAGE